MTSSPTQWETRDSSGAVISSQWEMETEEDEQPPLVPPHGRSFDSSWEESTAFREMSIAQGRFRVSRV